MSAAPIVVCRQVCKRYGRHYALHPLDLTIQPGEVFGFLGPNGAGKTTLIRLMLGLAAPSGGEIELFGEDLFAHRRRLMKMVGAVVEAPVFFEYLSAWENLTHLVALSGRVERARLLDTLDLVGLKDVAHKLVGTFSYGMKQRLGIAQALLPDSRFLVLDEPTNGLDPHGIAGVRDLVSRLAGGLGLTVFISSHLLSEVEQMCQRVVIIDHGRQVLTGRVEDLRRHDGEVTITVLPVPTLAACLAGLPPLLQPQSQTITAAGQVELQFAAQPLEVPSLVCALVGAGLDVLRVLPRERTLEDIFLEVTRSTTRDERADTIRAA